MLYEFIDLKKAQKKFFILTKFCLKNHSLSNKADLNYYNDYDVRFYYEFYSNDDMESSTSAT